MANVIYALPVAWPVRPYLRAGVGYGWLNFKNTSGDGLGSFPVAGGNRFVGADVVSFGSAGALAYQAIVGVSLPLRILSGLEATFEYRFFGTTREDVPVTRVAANTTSPVNGVIPSYQTQNGFFIHDSAILVGLRHGFGQIR